ncbi:MAG: zinc-dependent metalloprotease [Gemmatimonadales bacterium]
MTRLPALLLALTSLARSATAQTPPAPSQRPAVGTDIAAATSRMEKRDGFLPLYLDGENGKLLAELPSDTARMLVCTELATGLGSNPIGLDRGANGGCDVARFERNGTRVLVVYENWRYRSSGTSANARTVAEAFPPSTVAALPLVAAEGGRLLVDATDYVVRDWMDVTGALQAAQQGAYALARDRSSVYRPYTRGFPTNTEVDVALTFATPGRPGPIVSQIAPEGTAITLREHMSFLPLPDDAYRPRAADPRIGYFGITFHDFAQPIQAPLEQRWIARHRLERTDPSNPRSPVKDPIVYYIDRGIPEPIRTATVEGARFWEQAFALAGLPGGFRVEDLPEGADPMDARYNVVQWENRNERGWSVGGSIDDPRTGEILKGMARLDSHRARTDYNLYAGLLGADSSAADTAFVLARVRQVTAHEIGHTLGLAHNYIASTYERGSVMDYPPPRVRLGAGGDIDISRAYATGPGAYDVWAIHWGYGIFPPEHEADSLRAIMQDGLQKGYLFLSDGDARPEYGSDPRANLWDDAATPAEFLRHQMAVRRVAIARFGERNIRPGEPIGLLEERFVPIYFWHRFALFALAKAVGGMEYANAVRGDGQPETRPLSAAAQRAALTQLLGALEPAELSIPDTVVALLGPRPFGYGRSVELFGSRTRPAFDELGAARTLASMIVDLILQRDRAARLAQFAARDPHALSLAETIDALVTRTWQPDAGGEHRAALLRVAGRAVADRLLDLAADRDAAPEVRAMAEYKMTTLVPRARLLARSGSDAARAQWQQVAGDFTRWLERRETPQPSRALVAPPGDPFGIDP